MARKKVSTDGIQASLVSLEKMFGDEIVDLSGERPLVETISSGSVVLDHWVLGGGGFPRGMISEVYGDEASGKTTLGIMTCISAQKSNKNKGRAVYIDFEHAFDPRYAQMLGLNLDKSRFFLIQPSYMERGFDIASACVEHGYDCIVIDSVAAMLPKKVLHGDAEAVIEPGIHARVFNPNCTRLMQIIGRQKKTAVIMINQLRSVIQASKYSLAVDAQTTYTGERTTTGGRALKYFANVRLYLRVGARLNKEKEDPFTGELRKIPVAIYVKATCTKSKQMGGPHRAGDILIRFGQGVDNVFSLIGLAIQQGIINKGGSWYEYKSDKKDLSFRVQGLEPTRSHLAKRNDIVNDIMGKLNFNFDLLGGKDVKTDGGITKMTVE